MKLRYETGVATLIQFALVTMLALVNQVAATIESCVKNGSGCVNDSIVSFVFVVMVAVWLGIVSVVGYAAQDRRSKRLAQLLISFELLILAVTMFNARLTVTHLNGVINILNFVTSTIDSAIAIWVIALAWRLVRANGGRVVQRTYTSASRPRRRPTTGRQLP